VELANGKNIESVTGRSTRGDEGAHGLTTSAARSLLVEVGANEPAPARRTTVFAQLLGLFTNPLIAILLVASFVSAAVGECVNATIIFVMVLLGVAIIFIQTYHSQRAVERLRRSVAPTATVLRDAIWVELARREIVPGDLIRLVAGDLVPADAELIYSEHLHVQESALTGESVPVEKQAAPKAAASSEVARVYLGTSVVSGTGRAPDDAFKHTRSLDVDG
jgi:P-type Mg2+ transporter